MEMKQLGRTGLQVSVLGIGVPIPRRIRTSASVKSLNFTEDWIITGRTVQQEFGREMANRFGK